MKPDACNREAVALLACSALRADAAAETARHIAVCPACRGHFEEMSALCAEHATAARQLPAAAVSQQTYSRVARAARGVPRSWPQGWLSRFGLRWTQAAAAAAVGLLLAGSGLKLLRRPPPAASLMSQVIPPASPRATPSAADSKLITYRLALSRSLEELDRLLVADADRSSADPAIFYRAGSASLDP